MLKSFKDTKKMVVLALFSAIIIAMSFIPFTGYITYGAISITTLHVIVIIGAVLLGTKEGTFLGTVWGVTCILRAFVVGSVEAIIFFNPLISVVPRIIVGFITGFSASQLKKVIKNATLLYIICALIGTLSNTALVLSAIGLFAENTILPLQETLVNIFMILVSVNGTIEILVSVVIVPIVLNSINKAQIDFFK